MAWASEEIARGYLVQRIATLVRDHKGKIRRLVMIASEDAPLTPSARNQARASYLGAALKTTYREDVNCGTRTHVAPLVMLKRLARDGDGQQTGELVKW